MRMRVAHRVPRGIQYMILLVAYHVPLGTLDDMHVCPKDRILHALIGGSLTTNNKVYEVTKRCRAANAGDFGFDKT